MYTNKLKKSLKYFLQVLAPVLILTSGGCPAKFQAAMRVHPDGKVFVKGKKQAYLSTGFDLLADGCVLHLAEGGMKFFPFATGFSKEESFRLPMGTILTRPRQIDSVYRSARGTFVVTPVGVYQIFANKAPKMLDTKGVRMGTRYKSYFEQIDQNKKVQQYIGTSFNGVYTKALNGDTWENVSTGLPSEPYTGAYRFYEGVSKIFSWKNQLYCLVLPMGSIYHLDKAKKRWIAHSAWNAALPVEKVIYNHLKNKPEDPELLLSGAGAVYGIFAADEGKRPKKLMDWGTDSAWSEGQVLSYAPMKNFHPQREVADVLRQRRANTPLEVRSLYVNLDYLTPEKQKVINTLLKDGRFNSVIINLKDDSGNINYNSTNVMAKKIGARRPHPRLKEFMKEVSPYNPYVIARVVVFKDTYLQRYNGNEFAIWDSKRNKPWQANKFERWVDPYNPLVTDYNIEICREIAARSQELGIDEIQLDYARLPSDSSAFASAVCRSKPRNWTRYDMMETFFFRIFQSVDFHVSVDIYGYNGIYEMGNIIGQDAKLISQYVPTICPMYYPSHFGSMYLSGKKNSQAFETVHFGTQRANYWSHEGTSVRPYIQGFRRGAKYDAKYVQDQVRATRLGGATGFSMWNIKSEYKNLLDFIPKSFLTEQGKFKITKP